MSTGSYNQQTKLTRELKDFAFYESPQFRDNEVQAMEIVRSFEMHEYHETSPAEMLDYDETRINIGLRAVRYAIGGEACYTFNVYCLQEQMIHPNQLHLEPDEWYSVARKFEIDDGDDEDDEEIDDEALEAVMKDVLADEQAACEQYQRVDYRFNTVDGALRFSDENGYKIGREYFGGSETHPVDVQYRSLPDIADLTDESTGEDILNQILFEKVTEDLRDEFTESGDIMPYEEKLRELRVLVKCLRERKISL